MIAVARMDSARFGRLPPPSNPPKTTTIATYTVVINAPIAPKTTDLLMTRSMS